MWPKPFHITVFCFGLVLTSCSFYPTESGSLAATPECIVINELSARPSELVSEFGEAADWIELYNQTDEDIDLGKGAWYLSDDFNDKKKYRLPGVVVPAGGYLIVWCDKKDTFQDEVHTNFKLKSGGEEVGLYYCTGSGKLITIDEVKFDNDWELGWSYGRIFDGASDFIVFKYASPARYN